jgi:hypothetical protein
MKWHKNIVIKRSLLCSIFILALVLPDSIAAQSWQWTKRLGCDRTYHGDFYPDDARLIDRLHDSKGNHYLFYYITGDTFYYDDFKHKFYIKGGDGYAFLKVLCDGSLGWCKIFTHGRETWNSWTDSKNFQLFFGDNENRIVLSGGIRSGFGCYMDDTLITSNRSIEYTVIYDSTGSVVKRFVQDFNNNVKPNLTRRYIAMGYFPESHRYYLYDFLDYTDYTDSADRIVWKGEYLQRGEYFILLDSNMEYCEFTPVVLFDESRNIYNIDAARLSFNYNSQTPSFVLGNKTIMLMEYEFEPDNIWKGRYIAVGRDTFYMYDTVKNQYTQILMCYNDTGGHEWTKFAYALSTWRHYYPFHVWAQDDIGVYLQNYGGRNIFQGQLINNGTQDGYHQTNTLKIDDKGNIIWRDSVENKNGGNFYSYCFPDVNNFRQLVWNQELSGFNDWAIVDDKKVVNSKNAPYQHFTYNVKDVFLAVGKDTQVLVDTTFDRVRYTKTSHVSVDPANNVWAFGTKLWDGTILNNDSSDLIYGAGVDLYIGKYGRDFCTCDSIESHYLPTNTSQEGKISVSYNGSASDSVTYLWGDGTSTVAKPSYREVTKTYNKTMEVEISSVAYNKCYWTDTFNASHSIYCTPAQSGFAIIDSHGRDIELVYSGHRADIYIVLWGDGSRDTVKSNQSLSHGFSDMMDSAYISVVSSNLCGELDTFGRWYVFCPKNLNPYRIDTTYLALGVVGVFYEGTDSMWCDWGDGTESYKPDGIKMYSTNGDYDITIRIRDKCGDEDTSMFEFRIDRTDLSIQNTVSDNITIHPNPTNGDIVINFSSSKIGLFDIDLYDNLGHKMSIPKAEKLREKEYRLNLSHLPIGTYYILIEDKNGNIVKREKISLSK